MTDWTEAADSGVEKRSKATVGETGVVASTSPQRALKRLSMPWHNNTWYHVTDRANLYGIFNDGLLPRADTGKANFALPAEDNAVYLWPSIALAMSWQSSANKSGYGRDELPDAIILRIQNLDLNKMAPDHEEFASWLADAFIEIDLANDDFPVQIAQELDYESFDEFDQDFNGQIDFIDSIVMLQQLSPELRSSVAQHLSEQRGNPVMFYGPIPPEQIEVSKANIMTEFGENEWDTFYEQNQEWSDLPEGTEDEDAWYDDQNYAFENWIMNSGPWLEMETLAEVFDNDMFDPDTDFGDQRLKDYFDYQPISDYAKDVGLPGAFSAYDEWEPEEGAMDQFMMHRRPMYVDPTTGQPWIGNPGAFHPPDTPPHAILGEVDTGHNPPQVRFFNLDANSTQGMMLKQQIREMLGKIGSEWDIEPMEDEGPSFKWFWHPVSNTFKAWQTDTYGGSPHHFEVIMEQHPELTGQSWNEFITGDGWMDSITGETNALVFGGEARDSETRLQAEQMAKQEIDKLMRRHRARHLAEWVNEDWMIKGPASEDSYQDDELPFIWDGQKLWVGEPGSEHSDIEEVRDQDGETATYGRIWPGRGIDMYHGPHMEEARRAAVEWVRSNGIEKTADAPNTSTGDPQVDEAISSYRSYLEEHDMTDMFCDADQSPGQCYDAAYGFQEWAQQAGLKSDAVYWEYTRQGGSELYWGDTDVGEDSEVDESNEHMVTLVGNNGKIWLVDWTGSQYGFTDFPHVQPLASDDTGRRMWRTADADGLQDEGEEWYENPPEKMYRFEQRPEEVIMSEGMQPVEIYDWVNPLGNGVYMYGFDPNDMWDREAGDLYEIDVRGLEDNIQPDFEIDQAWFHPGPIPPRRLRKVADADHWWEPAMTNLNEGVKMPGEAPGMGDSFDTYEPSVEPCPHCGRPNYNITEVCPGCGMRIHPRPQVWSSYDKYGQEDISKNWVYLNGQVSVGGQFWTLAADLANEIGLPPDQVIRISNTIARGELPNDIDIALGTIRQANKPVPQIWLTTVDRNHVWDVVSTAINKQTPLDTFTDHDPGDLRFAADTKPDKYKFVINKQTGEWTWHNNTDPINYMVHEQIINELMGLPRDTYDLTRDEWEEYGGPWSWENWIPGYIAVSIYDGVATPEVRIYSQNHEEEVRYEQEALERLKEFYPNLLIKTREDPGVDYDDWGDPDWVIASTNELDALWAFPQPGNPGNSHLIPFTYSDNQLFWGNAGDYHYDIVGVPHTNYERTIFGRLDPVTKQVYIYDEENLDPAKVHTVKRLVQMHKEATEIKYDTSEWRADLGAVDLRYKDTYFSKRIPFLYHTFDDRMWIGTEGQFHQEIVESYPWDWVAPDFDTFHDPDEYQPEYPFVFGSIFEGPDGKKAMTIHGPDAHSSADGWEDATRVAIENALGLSMSQSIDAEQFDTDLPDEQWDEWSLPKTGSRYGVDKTPQTRYNMTMSQVVSKKDWLKTGKSVVLLCTPALRSLRDK